MQRDGFRCLRCRDEKSTLNVHHLKYTGDPWDAPAEHLETLCESCHSWRTELNERFLLMATASIPELVTIGLDISPVPDSRMAMMIRFIALADENQKDADARRMDDTMRYHYYSQADMFRGRAVKILCMGLNHL